MQGIKDWIRTNPEAGKALMRENLSYIFFRELTGPGPLGAINVPVAPRATVATDPKFVPLGAPVFLALDRPEAYGFWVAQDTGGANMTAIKDWIRANPEQGRALMRENLSYIFFNELTGPGPLGALNVPVTPRASVAADPNYVPLGAPIYLHHADRQEIHGLWVAQDTGGAIKGPNRFDTFWGAGDAAVATAGGMSASGQALILLPKGVAARALAQP